MSLHPPRRVSDDDQRLMVLYTLSVLGPCTELQLLQFLFEHDLMNYFDMMFALNDLCAGGQVMRVHQRIGFLYQLTEAGLEALALFGSRIPMSLKTLLQSVSGDWKARFRQERQYQQEVRHTPRGEYELTLTVTEQDMDMMRLTLSLPNRELCSQLTANWPKRAGEIYETVLRMLTEEKE